MRLLAVGKAAPGMARAAIDLLGGHEVEGLIVTSHPARVDPRARLVVAEHPVPGPNSETAGREALRLAASCAPDDVLLVLVSGGASSLMAVPAEGVTLADKRETTSRLMKGGADIHALNTVRKHLSAVKGGRLAARCQGSTLALAISDVIGDDLAIIGSGPTIADPSRYADALKVLDCFGGRAAYPPAVLRHLERGARGEIAETPKPGDSRLTRATTSVIGGRRNAMAGAAAEATTRGYHVTTIDEPIEGEARAAGRRFVDRVLGAGPVRPACVIASGETTVHVTGGGRGGRNQEFALAAAGTLAERGVTALLASAGTDGVDGPTDAAGAIVDETTIRRAVRAGLPAAAQALAANDSHPVFAALGDLIQTGPTGTNVGDLQVFLLA